MATLTTIKFSRDNFDYQVNIDFDDNAMMEDHIAFDVIAKVTNNEGLSYEETLRLELYFNDQYGRVLHNNHELYQFTFNQIDLIINPDTGEENIPGMNGKGELRDGVYDTIHNGLGQPIGEIINAMPVPDPFFGCIIKASISSVVGQAIICNELRNNYAGNNKTKQILNCLREHIKGIAWLTLLRAARCMIRLGV